FQISLALERRVFRHASAVIALGEPVKRVVVEEKGVPEDRVSVIYPGIDLDEYAHPMPPAAIPGIDPAHEVVMYIGSLVHPNQGVSMLVEALARVFEARPQARAALVGGPADAGDEYKRRLGAFGDRLVILSGQTPEAVVALSRRAAVLVHPRLPCRENYSVQSKIAVYLASGRPIVATDFGDYQTLLGQTGAGRLTEATPTSLADGILAVLQNPDLAARLASATGPVALEYFGMDRNIERYLHVYDRALASSPR
ncbi:MAG TPA: glycosyltransferase family 4 protein, partial [Isosphaeraceae bacterium]|nr:glycosyltransferase family 4 protein [Isosphaeraceae bacterium]